jgi:cytochrome P450
MPETTPGTDIDLDRLVDNFDAYDFDTAQHLFEVTKHARQKCPVSHSTAHGGYWLVTGYAAVREALSDPETYSSSEGVGFPHHQSLMMPPIDLDPPLQKDFRRLLNKYLSRAGIAQYEDAIRGIAVEVIESFSDRGAADLHRDFAAPFTAEVLARVILHIEDKELFGRARKVAAEISRNDPTQEGDRRAQLEEISEEILDERKRSGLRTADVIDALLYGEVDGRPLTRDERVGTLMILVMGGLSTTNAALTATFAHVAMSPGLEEHLRDTDWTRKELDEFLRFEPPVGSLSRTVMRDATLAGQPLRAGDVVLLHFASANRDPETFDDPDRLILDRLRNPHLSFGLGDHRCIGSNLARMQVEISSAELLARIEDIRLAEGTVLVRETGTGSGWTALPVTFRRRS